MNQEQILFGVASLWAVGLAAGVLFRKPRTLVVLSFAIGMSLLSLDGFLVLASLHAGDIETFLRFERFRIVAISALPAAWIPFSLCYSRGNSREFLSRWKTLLLMTCLFPLVPASAFSQMLTLDRGISEFGARPFVELRWPSQVVYVVVLVSAVVVMVNLERTFRASVGTLRWRIKFAVIGLGLIFAARVYTSSQALLYFTADTSLAVFNAGALLLGCVLVTVSFLRASLSGVVVYPSITVLQSSLTVFLAGVYLLAVGVLAKVVVFFGGDAAFPLKAFFVLVAIVSLGLLLASDRVRNFVRRLVSRHFHRPYYDYRVLWRIFTERTSSIVEERSYAQELANLISDAVQTLSVSVWLARESEGRLVLASSTSLPNAPLLPSAQAELDLRGFAREIARHAEPLFLEGSREKWVEELKQRNPDQFNKGGGRVCVPLLSKERLLGMLVVGDKVNGIPFSVEDFELFKCIGSQAANGLLNLQLAQQLVRAKEMEAFQTMAAFFVHDLKNTASSLSLMLQNLPAQMENPAFRQDALRAVTKALAKLNDLIARLGLLRENLSMTRVPTDLNQVVQSALDAVGVRPEVETARSFHELPKVLIDPEQVQKVVTNLLINAREAIAGKGRIRVETLIEGPWAVLSVADNGCGMSPEFLSRSLFRPFQTTKKNGIGIGMFHCKTIVEAHEGRIEAESEMGKGTTFRVRFPMAGGDD